MKLDKHSSVPLYAQLKELVLERIDRGDYAPGSRIPSELVLCDELDLSRPTVRQAIAELVAEGVLIIVKGKGTYVADTAEQAEISKFSAFSCSFLLLKNLVDHKIDSIDRVDSNEEIDKLFANIQGIQVGFWQNDRPMTGNGQLIGLCRSYIPVMMFPDLAEDIRLGKPMIDIVANKYAYLPQKGNLKLEVRAAGNQEALYLDISRRAPVIAMSSILTSRSGHICEAIRIVLRPDAAILDFEQNRL
jgi:GntR family transcriptional regulator